MSDFIHLHCHSEFSALDGMPKVDEYVIKCNKLGMDALALTEHGNLRSIYQLQIRTTKKFEFKGKKYDFKPIKPIFGVEFYITPAKHSQRGLPESVKRKMKSESKDEKEFKKKVFELETDIGIRKRYHLLVFAKNPKGLENIFALNHVAWKYGHYYRPRIDMELLKKHREGLVVTTSCIGGWAPSLVCEDKMDAASEWMLKMKKIFGSDLYVEIQPQKMDDQIVANKRMLMLADEFKLKVIATNDCHYLDKEDYKSHDVLLAIQSNKTLKAADVWKFDDNEFYVKTKQEMIDSFKATHPYISSKVVKLSLENTLEIAEKCNVSLEIDRKKGILPKINIPTEYSGENNYLIKLCKSGWQWREMRKRVVARAKEVGITEDESMQIYKDRLKLELNRIIDLKFTRYFLMIYDLVDWARKQDILVGPGRGSSSGSLVCFLLGITSIDPLKYGLLFDRFLNKNRIDFPDVDMDFEDSRRKEIFKYLYEKYGEDNVCQIGTVGRMKGKQCLLDVGRVNSVPVARTLEVNKHIVERSSGDARASQTVEDSFKEFDVCKEYNKEFPQVLKHVIKLEGKARQMGIHAAGIQVAPTDISKIIPIEYRKSGDETVKVSALDWMECQGLGLVKLDVLGLRTLTVLKTALKRVKEKYGVDVDLEKLEYNDEKVLGKFSEGSFVGIFQFDSVGMTMMCRELTFTNFNDIMVMNSLYRPGGTRSGWAKRYIPRKLGREEVPKVHPIFDAITKETFGILIYQEQLIRSFVELAGYDPGTGDELRKAMAKSYGVETMGKEKEHFIEGAGKNGMDKKTAKELFENMAFFGSYAFNKCVGKGTQILVSSATGSMKKISIEQAYKNKEKFVYSYDENRKVSFKKPIKEIIYSGKKELYEIYAETSDKRLRKIQATMEHRFLTDNGWKKLSELEVGDKVVTKQGETQLFGGNNSRFGIEPWNKNKKIGHNNSGGDKSEYHKSKLSISAKKRDRKGNPGKRNKKFIDWNRKHALRMYREGLFPQSHTSIQLKIKEFMINAGIWDGFEMEKKFKDRFSIDIANAELKIAIECHGDYWHANPKYYEKRNQTQGRNVGRDKVKKKMLEDDGWKLLIFWEEDINNDVEKCIEIIQNELIEFQCNPFGFGEIMSIEYRGIGDTYDIHVDDVCHNYLANQFVVHNSHASAYSAIAYWGMWLKTYYPLEFFYSLMKCEVDKMEIMRYVSEARKMNIKVLMPDVNKSGIEFGINGDGDIISGLVDIKGVGGKAAYEIAEHQPFYSIADMCEKVNRRVVNKGVFKSLISANSFKSLYDNTKVLKAEVKMGKKEMPMWEWMLEMKEEGGRELYDNYKDEPNYTEEEEMRMMSDVCPIPPPKHKSEYYGTVVKHLDKHFPLQKCGNIDWSYERVRIKGILVEVKYNNIGDFHKSDPSDEEKKRIGWGRRYATFNVEDDTGIKRSSIDIDIFPTFRHIIDRGLGTPIVLTGRTFQANELIFADIMVDMDDLTDKLEVDKPLKERFRDMDVFQRYFIRHPTSKYRKKTNSVFLLKKVLEKNDDKPYPVVVLIVRKKEHLTKKKKQPMAFVDIEDSSASGSMVVFPSMMEYDWALQVGNIVKLYVNKNKDGLYINKAVNILKEHWKLVKTE